MQRPTSVTVFGFINIAFGLFSMVGQLFALYATAGANSVAVDYASLEGGWGAVQQMSNFLSAIALLCAGFGLLAMKPWARLLSIGYAVYDFFITIVGTGFFLAFMLPEMRGQFDELNGSGVSGGGILVFVMISMSIGLGISLLHPGLLWYFMTRPHVKAAFAGELAAIPEPAFDHNTPPQPFSNNPYAAPAPISQPLAGVPASHGQPASEEVIATIIPVKNQPALASYYLGLFSLFPLLGLPLAIAALVLGRKGLAKVKTHPEVRGKAHAWVGVICGTLFGLFNLVLICIAGVAISQM